MLVRQISLHNFKAYRGTHTLDLPEPTPSANVYLFGGENGAGKTTLIQAVLLALYGVGAAGMPGMPKQGRDFRRRYAEWLAVSRNATARDSHDDHVTVGVSLKDGGAQIDIKRSLWFRADGSLDEEWLEVREDQDGRTELYSGDDAQDRASIWVPRHLATLIFFDGEQVRSRLGDDTGAIAQALDRLLDLEPVHKLISDIGRLSRDKRSALLSEGQLAVLDSWGTKRDGLLTDLEQTVRREHHLQSQADDLEQTLSTVQIAIDERLAGSSPITTSQIEAELSSLRERRDELRTRFGRSLGEWYYMALRPEVVHATLVDLTQERGARSGRERIKLEAEATDQFASRLIAELVGRLPKSAIEKVEQTASELRATIDEHTDAYSSDSSGGAFLRLADDELASAQTTAELIVKRDQEELRYLAEDLGAIQAEIERLESRKSELSAHGTVDRLLTRAHELREALSGIRISLGEVELEGEQRREQIAEVERSIARLTARAEDSEDADRWLSAAHLLSDGLRTYSDERRQLALAGVSRALLRRLRDLLHKQHLVAAVEIDPMTYETNLFGRGGRKVHLPSAGEHQLAAMAFAAAILDCSDSSLPMFIDTPLARLDASHRENVVSRFWPGVGRQVFVLSTDEEVRGDLLERLRPHVVETFVISHDDAPSESKILSGTYFGEAK